ncbi:class I SAM-dependent methyltransferase [Acinetobacter pollinis]|uniref:Ribosomal RNA small subunit methyltransferase J n=1 Tax=Acinetobacter pollinis TaxID=2605270 RepID=A0ABU6DUV1_9GAMM|nr:class I SAM-dependent methyltransferase [Acinetobacter pollinis]MEB5477631.1 class I SAM-dependent methyltransferase [Acinetobacter pollinis]
MQFVCWFEQEYEQKAHEIAARLQSRDVDVELCITEKVNVKFLRLHPELSFVIDRDGLSLSAQGMKMQPDWYAEIPRLKRASLKTEMLARATQSNDAPILIDATAGLGHDSLLMAKFGAHVTLIERHPILFTLLEEAYESAKKDVFLASITDKIQLIFADSASYLEQLAQMKQTVDVVYLDPMFPQRDQNQQGQKKQAQVKKQMQLLHMLLPEHGEMDLGDHLLIKARKVAKRVIVKRPRHAVFLNNEEPKHQWLGDACRFDAYFNMDT